MTFSVILSVYKNDNVVYFNEAVKSILDQTVTPNELLIVVDGPVPAELRSAIRSYGRYPYVRIEWLPENLGRGMARHTAIMLAKYEIIAIMDSDDICVPDRFEKQLAVLSSGTVDIVGSYIAEFKMTPGDYGRIRKVKLLHPDIVKSGKWKQSMNHVTIMFRKTAYVSVGGYKNFKITEDFDLLSRMAYQGIIFANIPEVLVYARVAADQFKKRGGMAYLKEELNVFRYLYQTAQINAFEYAFNFTSRVFLRLMPSGALDLFYRIFMRKGHD